MTPFQILSLVVFAGLSCLAIVAYRRGKLTAGALFVRVSAWILAGVAVQLPAASQYVADQLGIRRGADLVLYVFAVASLFSAIHFHGCYRTLQRQVTELIRREAISNARVGCGKED